MRVFGWRDTAALAAGLGAMCLCTLLVSHARHRTTLVPDDFAWNRGSLLCFFVSDLFATSERELIITLSDLANNSQNYFILKSFLPGTCGKNPAYDSLYSTGLRGVQDHVAPPSARQRSQGLVRTQKNPTRKLCPGA
jgi:hypothetical protein